MRAKPREAKLMQLLESRFIHSKNNRSNTSDLVRCISQFKDKEAFKTLIEWHGPEVLRWCNYFMRNQSDAEDLFQDVFLTLWIKVGGLRDSEKLSCWLFQIVRNKAITKLRKRRRVFSLDRIQDKLQSEHTANPVITREYIDILMGELGKLDIDEQNAILLIKVKQISYDAAAREMGKPIGSLSTCLRRGLEKLAERMKRHQLEFSLPLLIAGYATECSAISPVLVHRIIQAVEGLPQTLLPFIRTSGATYWKVAVLSCLIGTAAVSWWTWEGGQRNHIPMQPIAIPRITTIDPAVIVMEKDFQRFKKVIVPKLLAALSKAPFYAPPRLVTVTQGPDVFECVIDMSIEAGSPKHAIVTSRLYWHYGHRSNTTGLLFDPQANGQRHVAREEPGIILFITSKGDIAYKPAFLKEAWDAINEMIKKRAD